MTDLEIVRAMSEEDAGYAVQSLRAYDVGDTAGAEAAVSAMSPKGFDLFVTLLERKAGKGATV